VRIDAVRSYLLSVYENARAPVSNSYALFVHVSLLPALELTEQSMRSFSFLVSTLASRIRKIAGALGPWEVRKYRPERHYMRGPGPKWREKHSSRPV
jgi:hypothetical protein